MIRAQARFTGPREVAGRRHSASVPGASSSPPARPPSFRRCRAWPSCLISPTRRSSISSACPIISWSWAGGRSAASWPRPFAGWVRGSAWSRWQRSCPRTIPSSFAVLRRALIADGVALHEGHKVVERRHRRRQHHARDREAKARASAWKARIFWSRRAGSRGSPISASRRRASPSRTRACRSTPASHHEPAGLCRRRCRRRPAIHPSCRLSCRHRHPQRAVPPAGQGRSLGPALGHLTDPELAHVGLERGGGPRARAIRLLRWPLAENDRAQAEHREHGSIKLVTTPSGRILGADIVAPGGRRDDPSLDPGGIAAPENRRRRRHDRPLPDPGEIGKRAAGNYFLPKLFSHRTSRLVRLPRPASAEDERSSDGEPTAIASYLPPPGKSLSARVLLLTIAFVMLGEVLIYAPSAGRFRYEYLRDRLATAHVAMLALLATPDYMVSDSLQAELLQHARAYVVALKRPDGVKLMMRAKQACPQVDATYDLDQDSFFGLIGDAFATLWQAGNRVMRVMGASPRMPKAIGRDRHRRGADARRPHRLFRARAGAFHRHLPDHRRPRLSQPAMADDPAHAAADRSDGRLPRRSGGSLGRHPAQPAQRRDRRRRARAGGDAGGLARRAAAEDPARRTRWRGQQDQSRSAQHPLDRGPGLRPADRRAAIPRCGAMPGPAVRHRPGRRALQHHPQFHPRGAAGPASDALSPGRADRRGRPHLARSRRRSPAPLQRGPAESWRSKPTGASSFGSSPIWSRTRPRRVPPASRSRPAGRKPAKAMGPGKIA